jgi:hypothetical protein
MPIPEHLIPLIVGTESGGDQNALFGYVNRPGGQFSGVNVSDMTVDEVLQFQDPSGPYAKSVRAKIGKTATPAGAFQIVGSTLRQAKEGLGLTGSERFDPQMQRRLADWIYDKQGIGAWEGPKKVGVMQNNIRGGILPQVSGGYTPFSVDGLSRSQRTMLGFAALRDAAAALRNESSDYFAQAMGGLQREHQYGQELAYRQAQEQRLIDQQMQSQAQNAIASRLRTIEALTEVQKVISDQRAATGSVSPSALQLEQALLRQLNMAVAPGVTPAVAPGVTPAVAPGAEPAVAPGAEPAVAPGAEPAADQPMSDALANKIVADQFSSIEDLAAANAWLQGRPNKQAATRAAETLADRQKQYANADKLSEGVSLVDEITSSQYLDNVIGYLGQSKSTEGLGKLITSPEEADILAKINQIQGKIFLEAFESLKGGGPVSDAEGKAAVSAASRLKVRGGTVEGYKKALRDLQAAFSNRAARAKGLPIPYPNYFEQGAGSDAVGSGVKTYNIQTGEFE